MFGGRFGGFAGVGEEADDVFFFFRQRFEDFLRFGGQLGQLVLLFGQLAEDLVDVAQGRVGFLDRRLEVAAAARQARRRVR